MEKEKFTILCIDDDEDVLSVLRTVLESAGYKFAGARSSKEGLLKYKEIKPDLIIVDLMMEDLDSGTEFVKNIRALNDTLPVYMLSSVGDQLHSSAPQSQLGLSGIFQKPINPEVLVKTVAEKLKRNL